METIVCVHIEHMKGGENHTEIGECQICHQVVSYDRLNLKAKPTVTKLGRIDGKVVLPKPSFNLELSGKDRADLTVARLQAASSLHPLAEEKPTASIPPRPGADNPKARLKWYHDNKKAMITDLINLGNEAFLKKWGLSPRMVSHLKADKYYKKLAQKTPPAPAAEPKARKAGAKAERPKQYPQLPELPPWNDNWPPEFQLLWLRIYDKRLNVGGAQ